MNVIIKGKAIESVQKLLTEAELERYKKEHRFSSTKIELDVSRLCDATVESIFTMLDDIANDQANPDSRSAALSRNIVKQWQDIKKNPSGGIVNKLKNVPSAIQQYVATSENRFLFYQLEDGNSVPYFLTEAKYVPPSEYNAAHVNVYFAAHNSYDSGSNYGGRKRGGGGGKSLTFHENDYRDKTMSEMLQSHGYYLETPERMTEYEQEMNRFLLVRKNEGHQVNVQGKAVAGGEWYSSSFRSIEKSGRPAKMVVDPKEEEHTPISATTCDFWPDKDEDHLWDIPYHPFLRLFDLEDHASVRAHINNISVYKYDKNVGDKLVLDPEFKELLEILVSHAADSFVDIVSGKEGGSVVLCAGPPGVGKTLTAEVYSEVMERPLYRVQSSQLGITVRALEEELKKVLQRAERWGAILLIDEADVYVRARGTDIEQNAIVGVFLRVLEYYRGVLFMTTNMGTTIDDAIVSRVTARMNYELPAEEQQKELWTILSKQNGVNLLNKEIAQILVNHPQLSGRDIKNLLKLAGRVANAKGIEVSAELIKTVSKFKQ